MLTIAACLGAANAAVKLAPDCTQSQRQAVNKLLQQDVNPTKACINKAKGDITTLSTSRLCPLPECETWLEWMAEKAPDCMYDDIDYGKTYKLKAKDCSSSGSSSGSAGSSNTTTATTKPAKTNATESSAASEVVHNVTHHSSAASEVGVSSASGSQDEENVIHTPATNDTISTPETASSSSEAKTSKPTKAPSSGASRWTMPLSVATVAVVAAAL